MTREQTLYVFSLIRTIGAIITSVVNVYLLWRIAHHL